MLRPSSALVLAAPLLWGRVLGQVTSGPPVFVLPAASALNASTTINAVASTLPLSETSISAPRISVFTFSESFGQSSSNVNSLPTSVSGMSSSLSTSSVTSDSFFLPTTGIVSIAGLTVLLQEPATSTATVSVNGTTVTILGSRTAYLNSTVSSSGTLYRNSTILQTSASMASAPQVLSTTVTIAVDSVQQQASSPSIVPSSIGGSPSATPSQSLQVSTVVVTELSSQSSESTVAAQTSLAINATPSVLLNAPSPSAVATPSPPPEITSTSVVLGGPVVATSSAAVTALPTVLVSAESTSPFSSPLAILTTTPPAASQCTATVWMTETVTVFQTITETCPTTGSTTISLPSSSAPTVSSTAVSTSSALPPVSGNESNGTCSAQGNTTQCQPGVSKLFGPIVVDILVEEKPSTFSTVTVYTTSGFITEASDLSSAVSAPVTVPSSCSTAPSGNIVCNGCPSTLFGVACAYICTVVGSPTPASFCESDDKTGMVAAEEGVMQCIPCTGISSTLTFAPTEPIIKGVTGAPAATATFTETPSILGTANSLVGPVTQPNFLSSAEPTSGTPFTSVAPETFQIPATEDVSSFTLVALSSPAVPTPMPAAITSSGSLIVTIPAVTETVPVTTVVPSLPQLGTSIAAGTTLVATPSSAPSISQAATTVVKDSGAGDSCTSVPANAKPSPAYTDQQNGMLYRIQCGTTLDLVTECPFLCSEGGGGLFRQCETSDQSGASPSAGGVGIVCQKCLPPCGSSSKRNLDSVGDANEQEEYGVFSDEISQVLVQPRRVRGFSEIHEDDADVGRDLIRKNLIEQLPVPYNALPSPVGSTSVGDPSSSTSRTLTFESEPIITPALTTSGSAAVVQSTSTPSHCMPRMGCPPAVAGMSLSKFPASSDATVKQAVIEGSGNFLRTEQVDQFDGGAGSSVKIMIRNWLTMFANSRLSSDETQPMETESSAAF